MLTQSLFPFAAADDADAPPPPIDPDIDPADRRRVTGQNAAILDLLASRDEVSNAELAAISLKYTGRISDLRAAGHVIVIARRVGGTRFYRLAHRAG